jgi:hypothetical protein
MLLAVGVVIGACDSRAGPADPTNAKTAEMNDAASSANAPPPSHDIAALANIVPLSPAPVAVTWQRKILGGNRVSAIPGPTDYELTAVLEYREADVAAIVGAASKAAPGVPGEVEWETWFPAKLKTQAVTAPDGRSVLKGERFQPTAFKRAPLLQGTLTRIGKTNAFVLSLFTT